jgi:hypothetical protein
MLTQPIKFSTHQKSLSFVLVLGIISLLPLQASIGSYLLDFLFFRHLEKPGFFLMLAVYSFIWALLGIKYGTLTFNHTTYVKHLSSLLLIYGAIVIVVFIVTSAAHHFIGRGSTTAALRYVATYADVLTVGIFLLYVFRSVKHALSQQPSKLQDRTTTLISIIGACVFMGIVVSDFYCSSYSCRQAYLVNAIGEEPHQKIKHYINNSPKLLGDIGNLESVALKRGSTIENESFLDYMVRVSMEVHGDKGQGYLAVQMTGNDYSQIDRIEGKWTYQNIETFLDSSGITTRYEPLF